MFAISIMLFGVIGGGMFQANQTYGAITSAGDTIDEQAGVEIFGFLDATWFAFLFGIIFAGLVALVIIGGIRSIGAVTGKLIPIMGSVYVIACLVVIIGNIGNLGRAFDAIITGAFSPQGIGGGVLGVIIIGVQRAAFSNEAGIGSAPIAHSAVKTRRPVSEGFVAALEPFIDTVVVCTMTALVIIFAWPADFEASIGVGHDNPVEAHRQRL